MERSSVDVGAMNNAMVSSVLAILRLTIRLVRCLVVNPAPIPLRIADIVVTAQIRLLIAVIIKVIRSFGDL